MRTSTHTGSRPDEPHEVPAKRTLISEDLEYTKLAICTKINDLNSINKTLKAEYVPMPVINNLNQSIKDVEVNFIFF